MIKTVEKLEAEIDKVKEEDIAKKYGMPLPLAYIIKNISEGLPEAEEGIQFLSDISDAIGDDGKDLRLVHSQFLRDLLKRLPEITPEMQMLIDGISLLAEGKEWSAEAARLVVSAAHHAAAEAAARAARAADAADWAANTARVEERRKQAQSLIQLLKEAPLKEAS